MFGNESLFPFLPHSFALSLPFTFHLSFFYLFSPLKHYKTIPKINVHFFDGYQYGNKGTERRKRLINRENEVRKYKNNLPDRITDWPKRK